jgi:hypothetical protein
MDLKISLTSEKLLCKIFSLKGKLNIEWKILFNYKLEWCNIFILGGIMKKMKLKVREEAKKHLKDMFDILNSKPLSEEHMSKTTAEGCGAYCMVTCAYYCRPVCTSQCTEFCSTMCDRHCANGNLAMPGGGSPFCESSNEPLWY